MTHGRILVAIDLGPATEAVIAAGAVLAGRCGTAISLLHVVEPDPEFVGFDVGPASVRHQLAEVYRREHATIQGHAGKLRAQGFDAEGLLIQGSAGQKILDEVVRLDVLYVVVGSHDRSVAGLLRGSTSKFLSQNAHVPVVLVPRPSGVPPADGA